MQRFLRLCASQGQPLPALSLGVHCIVVTLLRAVPPPQATVSYVLAAEFVPPSCQVQLSSTFNIFWAVGLIAASPVAMLVPPQAVRTLVLVMSVPGILNFILSLRWLSESARFLSIHNRHAEAVAVLGRVARMNGQQVPTKETLRCCEVESTRAGDVRLLWKRSIRRQTGALMFAWLVTAMVYYGLILNPKTTDESSVFWESAVGAVVEMLANGTASRLLVSVLHGSRHGVVGSGT